MPQAYSDPDREDDPHALPDIEVFELTAREVAEREEDLIHDYLRDFPLATMNSRERDRMFEAIIDNEAITGGWYYWYCFPGCLPDSDPIGPYDSYQEALAAAQEEASE